MPNLPVPPTLVVVALGILASVGWGLSDFGGGLTSRNAPVLGVLLGSQIASSIVGLPILFAISEPAMRPVDVVLSLIGGLLGSTGLALLYRGLSSGRMGVVAPVAAVLTATIPVVFGFVTEGLPSIVALGGIAAAGVSVVLVSRSTESSDVGPTGLAHALGAGTLFGLFTITVSQLDDELVLSPLLVIRVASILCISTLLIVSHQPWRVPRRLWPAIAVVGLFDMAATACYLIAIAIGPLAIASILSSLYPVVTTMLAVVVLRERITRAHAAGIVAAGLAVTLIAAAPSI